MKKIYLAIPYTGMQELSFKTANKVAAKLMKKGYLVYSPISHSHPIATQENLPKTWEYWEDVDTEFLKWCDYLYVVTLDGWKEGVGVQAEIRIAKACGKQIVYYLPKEENNETRNNKNR